MVDHHPVLVAGYAPRAAMGQLMPRIDVTGWIDEAVAEQVDRLKHAGAEPEVRIELRWRSAAERAQDAQDAADERRSALLRRENLKGSAKSYASRGKR